MELNVAFCFNDDQLNKVYLFRQIRAEDAHALTSEWRLAIKEAFSFFSASKNSSRTLYFHKEPIKRGYDVEIAPAKDPILTVDYFSYEDKAVVHFFKRNFFVLSSRELLNSDVDDLLYCVRYVLTYKEAYTPVRSVYFCRKETQDSYFGIECDCALQELQPFFDSYQYDYSSFMRNLPTGKLFPQKYMYDSFDDISFRDYNLPKTLEHLMRYNHLYTNITPTRYRSLKECPADAFLIVSFDELTERLEFAYKQETPTGAVITSTPLSFKEDLSRKISVILQFEEYYAAWQAQLAHSFESTEQYIDDLSSERNLFYILILDCVIDMENQMLEDEFQKSR